MSEPIRALLAREAHGVSADALESAADSLAVTATSDAGALLDRLRGDGVDCLVVAPAPEAPLAPLERVDAASGVDPPVVLYAEGADAEVLGRALNLGVDRYVDLAAEGVGALAHAAEEVGRSGEDADRFRAFFEEMPTAGFVVDDEGVTTAVNDTFCERTGYDREEVVGKPLDELPGILPDADREKTIERFEQMSEGETPPPVEMEYRTREGERRYAYVESVPIFEDGEFDRLIGTSRDVTELKHREQELARQNERLERFAGILSHDLRNHLEVLAAEIELSRLYDQPPDVDRIERAVDRMHQIVDDTLTMARQGGPVEETQPASLSRLAEESWRGVETDAATLGVEGDAVFECDPSRVQELFENLYRNAVEHGGQDVTVRVGPIGGEGEREGSGGETGDDPRGFYVADDGPGIDPGERESVFEPGYTTAEDGTGFGLNVVREMARCHGWDVAVTESDEGGARFEFTGVDPARDRG